MNLERPETHTASETDFHPEAVAFAVTTYYPKFNPNRLFSISDTENVRGNLALSTIRFAKNNGFHVLVADGGSSHQFLDIARSYDANVFDRGGEKRDQGRRKGIEVGSQIPGVKAILRTEPEKFDLVQFTQAITAPLISGEADIVIPKRLEPSFGRFYPDYMHDSEVKANQTINNLLQKLGYMSENQYFDFFFGPIALRNDAKVVATFMERFSFDQFVSMTKKYPSPENHANAQIFPVIKGLISGELKVASVDVNFYYPSNQKANEEAPDEGTKNIFIEKRRGQRYGILDEVIHAIRYYDDRYERTRLVPLDQ